MTLRTRKLHVPAWVSWPILLVLLCTRKSFLTGHGWAAFFGYAKTPEGKEGEREEKNKREKSGKSGRREVKFIGVCFSASEGVNNKGVARGVLECPWTLLLCKPFCKQTTYNIQMAILWVPSVWFSVTPPLWNILATPMNKTRLGLSDRDRLRFIRRSFHVR